MDSALERFLELLKDSPDGAVFNPWWQVDDENDVGSEAPAIRRRQLSAYLSARLATARLVLVGEALGYRGGHFTGIAMTSERMLIGGNTEVKPREIFPETKAERTSKPDLCPAGFSEATASIVWGTMRLLGVPAERFVLWNVFAWHPYNPRAGILSNRTPTAAELDASAPVLKAFLELFPCEWVAAVGRLSACRLPSAERVRHPASGGMVDFRRQLGSFVIDKTALLQRSRTSIPHAASQRRATTSSRTFRSAE
jgi:uracil-DNA glycosylase